MTLAVLLAYCGALFIAAVIPGPGITAIVARALGSGFRPTFFMGLGLILGDMLYLTAVILGLAFIAQTFTTAFLLIKIAGALYLGYIAWKLWTTGLLPQNIEAKGSTSLAMSFLSGLFVTLGNPKTMLFYVAGADAGRSQCGRAQGLRRAAGRDLHRAPRRAGALYRARLAGAAPHAPAEGVAAAEPARGRGPCRHRRLYRDARGIGGASPAAFCRTNPDSPKAAFPPMVLPEEPRSNR